MRRRWMTVVVAGAAAAWCVPLPVAGAADAAVAGATGGAIAAGSWRHAIEVPGLGALNAGGNAWVFSVSCGSAGNCAAGGQYADGSGHIQAFVASERNGRWVRPVAAIGGAGRSERLRAHRTGRSALGVGAEAGRGDPQIFGTRRDQG